MIIQIHAQLSIAPSNNPLPLGKLGCEREFPDRGSPILSIWPSPAGSATGRAPLRAFALGLAGTRAQSGRGHAGRSLAPRSVHSGRGPFPDFTSAIPDPLQFHVARDMRATG